MRFHRRSGGELQFAEGQPHVLARNEPHDRIDLLNVCPEHRRDVDDALVRFLARGRGGSCVARENILRRGVGILARRIVHLDIQPHFPAALTRQGKIVIQIERRAGRHEISRRRKPEVRPARGAEQLHRAVVVQRYIDTAHRRLDLLRYLLLRGGQ